MFLKHSMIKETQTEADNSFDIHGDINLKYALLSVYKEHWADVFKDIKQQYDKMISQSLKDKLEIMYHKRSIYFPHYVLTPCINDKTGDKFLSIDCLSPFNK